MGDAKKYFKVKDGFVWLNEKGEQNPNCQYVATDDPAIKGQEQKLDMTEEYEDASDSVEEAPKEEPKKDEAKPKEETTKIETTKTE